MAKNPFASQQGTSQAIRLRVTPFAMPTIPQPSVGMIGPRPEAEPAWRDYHQRLQQWTRQLSQGITEAFDKRGLDEATSNVDAQIKAVQEAFTIGQAATDKDVAALKKSLALLQAQADAISKAIGGMVRVRFDFPSPLTVWVMPHNRGIEPVAVSLYDPAGVHFDSLDYNNGLNEYRAEHGAAYPGFAILSF